jgi:cobalt-zinc-cadmium efflux system outer membrane protein
MLAPRWIPKSLESLATNLARVVLNRIVMRRAWIAAAVLAGCVPSQSEVFGPVARDVQQGLGVGVTWSEDASAAAIAAMLARPIDLDTAVRIALARNRRLQARFDELGIAASQIADATVLPPATVDADYKRALSGGGSEIELTVVQDVLDLLQIGQRRGIASAELHGAQARAVAATVELAAEVELAFYDAIAADQERELVQTAFDAANASAELIERQHAAGNTTDLALAREQDQRERMRIEVGRAEQIGKERRARLGGLLGLGEAPAWTTAGRLPAPPATVPALDDLEQAAASSSLDLRALRADEDAAAARHRYAMVRTLLPELGAGVAAARRDGGDWEVGPALRIGIPLFNQQQGPRARAIAEGRRARNEMAATVIELRVTAQTTRARVQQAFAEVHQLADVVMPLRKRVLDETVLQYNAMNASTVELLIARRDMVDVGRQYIDALRRYWRAMAEAQALRRGRHAMPSKDEAP